MFHKDYERKIDQLVNELTLEEKIKMIHGAGLFRTGAVERLESPIVMSDGPTGVRFEFLMIIGAELDIMMMALHTVRATVRLQQHGTGSWQKNQERYLVKKPEDVARISYLRRVLMSCGRRFVEEILSISVKIHI